MKAPVHHPKSPHIERQGNQNEYISHPVPKGFIIQISETKRLQFLWDSYKLKMIVGGFSLLMENNGKKTIYCNPKKETTSWLYNFRKLCFQQQKIMVPQYSKQWAKRRSGKITQDHFKTGFVQILNIFQGHFMADCPVNVSERMMFQLSFLAFCILCSR